MEITSRRTSPSWTGLTRTGMEFLWADISTFGNSPVGHLVTKSLGPVQDFWPRSMRGRQEVFPPRRLGGVDSSVWVLVRRGVEGGGGSPDLGGP